MSGSGGAGTGGLPRVHLTVLAEELPSGRYRVPDTASKLLEDATGDIVFPPDSACIVSVKDAPLPLPTAIGAVIGAVAVYGPEPLRLTLARPGANCPWLTPTGGAYRADEIERVVTVHSEGVEVLE